MMYHHGTCAIQQSQFRSFEVWQRQPRARRAGCAGGDEGRQVRPVLCQGGAIRGQERSVALGNRGGVAHPDANLRTPQGARRADRSGIGAAGAVGGAVRQDDCTFRGRCRRCRGLAAPPRQGSRQPATPGPGEDRTGRPRRRGSDRPARIRGLFLKLTAWRIFKKKHAASAFSGEGARRFGGRWNSKGVAVIYASESPSLAALEMLVHLQSQELLQAYLLASISFEASLVKQIPLRKLPRHWRRDPAPPALQALGDRWIAAAASAVLRVPSVIIAGQWNYLFNPEHPDFAKSTRGKPTAFRFDRRLVK